jgi:hypothetical protein
MVERELAPDGEQRAGVRLHHLPAQHALRRLGRDAKRSRALDAPDDPTQLLDRAGPSAGISP